MKGADSMSEYKAWTKAQWEEQAKVTGCAIPADIYFDEAGNPISDEAREKLEEQRAAAEKAAREKAAAAAQAAAPTGKEQRAKVWELQTQLYDTYGNPYIDIDALKARLDELHKAGELPNYAYIIHDRDKYTQADEDEAAAAIARGSKRRAVKAGENKPEHIHVELQLKNARTLTALAKWLSCPTITIPPQWVVYVRENEAGEVQTFEDKCVYLCHERQPDKTPYRYDEIVCTFNYEDMVKAYARKMARKNKNKASRAFVDEHVNAIAAGKETITEFIQKFGYAEYEARKSKFDHAEQYYLQTSYQGVGFRLTYLITGPSTLGKTPLAKLLACSLFPEIKNPREVYFCTGDKGSTFQSYRGQPVIIWDDWRAAAFISHFGREVVFGSLFQVHPDPTDFNIKYGQTVLRHTVNIVTSTEGLDEFALALAGEYTDKFGSFHKGEEQQILQAYKRIWGLSEVTEAEITIMFNRGYYEGAASLDFYKQYQLVGRLQNKTRALVEKYAPALYGTVGQKMLPMVGEKYQAFAAMEAGKIADPELIDEADIPLPLPLPEDWEAAADAAEEREMALLEQRGREQEADELRAWAEYEAIQNYKRKQAERQAELEESDRKLKAQGPLPGLRYAVGEG